MQKLELTDHDRILILWDLLCTWALSKKQYERQVLALK